MEVGAQFIVKLYPVCSRQIDIQEFEIKKKLSTRLLYDF